MLPLTHAVEEYLSDLDRECMPLSLIGVDSQILQCAGDLAPLDPEVKRGIMAEFNAFRFQVAWGEREPWGIYWTPLASGITTHGEQWYTPDVGGIGAPEVEHWAGRARRVSNPVLSARYADLAWEIGSYVWKHSTSSSDSGRAQRPNHEMGRQAVTSYLQAITERRCADTLQAGVYLSRAMELAASLRDSAQLSNAKELLFSVFVNGSIDTRGPWWLADDIAFRFGARIGLTDAENEQVLVQLDAVLRISTDANNPQTFDPHVAMDAADRISRRVGQRRDDMRSNDAVVQAAEAFEVAASQANALTAAAWLEPLISRYRSIGKGEAATRVEAAIRARASQMQSEMKTIGVKVDVSDDDIQKWQAQFRGGTLIESLRLFAMACVVGKEASIRLVRTMEAKAPLWAMAPTTIQGSHGFTTAAIGSVEADLDGRAIHQAASTMGWQGAWVLMALDAVRDHHQPTVDCLLGFLESAPAFTQDRIPFLRLGLQAWLDRNWCMVIHVLVPQVEAGLRNVLVVLGGSVQTYDEDVGGFQVSGLGKMLDHPVLRAKMPENWRFHLKVLYSDARGINLRNELAHGLLSAQMLTEPLANWVLHTIMLLGAIRVTTAASDEGQP